MMEHFDQQAALGRLLDGPRNPEQPFVAGGVSFGRVYEMAAALRSAMREVGAGRGIALCLAVEDRARLAAAVLAAASSGSTLLLPHAFSPRLLAELHEATGYRFALADDKSVLPPSVALLAGGEQEGHPSPSAEQWDGKGILLNIFTGGTTGAPRFWPKTAVNLLGEAFFLARRFAVQEDDLLLATVPPYHIYGLLFSVLLPLAASISVVGATPSFPAEIVDTLRRGGATLLASVPAHYRALRRQSLAATSLRLAFSSAGMLDAGDNLAFCRASGVDIVEVYGSTETGGIATRNRAAGEEAFRPFSSVAWRIGGGERLCVSSPFLSPGLPLSADGFFTTGDRVSACGANGFQLRGREDGVVKVGGKRVELDEVAGRIKKISGVRDCLVLALDEAAGREKRLVALVEGDLDGAAIRKGIASLLEPHALPKHIAVVERMPMTANGKYDRRAIARLLTS